MKHAMPVLCLVLTACVATTDLKRSGTLSDADRQVAQTMAERSTAVCSVERIRKGTTVREPETVKFTHLAEIRRLFRSNTGWYKAHFFADGVDGVSYLNIRTQHFMCSEALWQRLSNSSLVEFSEILDR